ncbi:MAG: hypothetical protein L0Z53_02070 [Acidobacteriales bacterium]|nr:hypothetical protein [Terriglobales bacterium]
MSKIREKAVCVVSAEEVDAWQRQGIEPNCAEHRHISEKDARLYVFPWQTVAMSESIPTAKIVGRHKGRVCIQMIGANEWKRQSRSCMPAETGMRYLAISTQQLKRV